MFYTILRAASLALWTVAAVAQQYTVHSTFVFANTGDRTPLLDSESKPQLTNLGATQMHNLGSYFRRRYITADDVNPLIGASMIRGLSSWKVDNNEVFVQVIEADYTAASAAAFMQGLYPPFNLGDSNASSILDSSAMVSNGTYIDAPLGGYQYSTVNTASIYDPYLVYLSGTNGCENFANSALDYYRSESFNVTESNTRSLYQSLGQAALNNVLPQDLWSYSNAYNIYDYISYMYTHNTTAYETLSGPGYQQSVDQLGALASQKQWEIYGDKNVSGVYANDRIRTIGGQTLAARVAGLLLNNVATSGGRTKFNLAVGEYDVMLALFSLMDLPNINDNFKYIPPFASAFAFELFSYENESTINTYPTADELWVRFLYINGSLGTDNEFPSIQAYPIFRRGPSETDIRWSDFFTLMTNIGLENIGDWCTICGSDNVYCPTFTSDGSSTGSSGRRLTPSSRSMSPEIAGVIGAAVTVGALLILLALAMLLGGVRFHRNNKSKKSDLGGFKGSAKLASDADLHIPKNAAPIGVVATEIDEPKRGHERVGSWEMGDGNKKDPRDTFSSFGGATVKGDDYGRKSSFDEDYDRDGINPFSSPVNPRESV